MNKKEFSQELIENLTENILPYWMEKMSDPRGGYYGRRDGDDRLDPDAAKGAILNARILWTFSAAYRVLRRPEYLEHATARKITSWSISSTANSAERPGV